jgi:hypothetical protein
MLASGGPFFVLVLRAAPFLPVPSLHVMCFRDRRPIMNSTESDFQALLQAGKRGDAGDPFVLSSVPDASEHRSASLPASSCALSSALPTERYCHQNPFLLAIAPFPAKLLSWYHLFQHESLLAQRSAAFHSYGDVSGEGNTALPQGLRPYGDFGSSHVVASSIGHPSGGEPSPPESPAAVGRARRKYVTEFGKWPTKHRLTGQGVIVYEK